MRGVKGGQAAMSERRAGPNDPRTRSAHGRAPAEPAQPVVEGARRGDRLTLSPERRSHGQVSAREISASGDLFVTAKKFLGRE